MDAAKCQWVHQFLSKTSYENKERVFNEIKDVTNYYNGLTPQIKKIFIKGYPYDQMGLTGVIPVFYNNNSYNIPIGIWLLFSFPVTAPEFVVMPTDKMVISTSEYVNREGKVTHPYLTSWPENMMKSSIVEFLSIIRGVFSVKTPVVAKVVNPYIPQNRYSTQPPSITPNLSLQQPQLPHMYQSPPMPNLNLQQPPHLNQIYNQNSYMPTTSQPIYSVRQPSYSYNMPVQPPIPTVTSNISPSMNQPQIYSSLNRISNNSSSDLERTELIQEVRQKIKNNIADLDKDMKKKIDKLLNDNKELNENEKKINNSQYLFKEEMIKLDKNISLLLEKNNEISEKVEELKNRKEMDPDEIITATPLMNQLINVSAEECVIEDMIYYLGKALTSEKIDLNFYLKNIRSLSREQFLKKVLIKKIRTQAQLF